MNNSYKECMDKLVLSEEAKKSIIAKTAEAAKKKQRAAMQRARFIKAASGIAACFVIFCISYRAGISNPSETRVTLVPPMQGVRIEIKQENNENVSANLPNIEKKHDNVNTAAGIKTPSAESTAKPVPGENSEAAEVPPKPPVKSEEHDIPAESGSVIDVPNDGEAGGGPCLSGNPFADSESIEDIEEELGYKIKTPGYMPEGYEQDSIALIGGSLVQIVYADNENTIVYRTEKTSEDISGDYNVYDDTDTIAAGDYEVTIKGSGGKYNCALWNDGENAYSIGSNEGLGRDQMQDIAAGIR